MTVKLITTALGGLALFVYGMGLMSDGLKETAGAKMKAALALMTRNRYFAILAGAAVTALIQSSSATSVMTVGFVNAGLLSLEQAIGVIFGANIGTTITGQIVALKLNDLALPAITLGVIGIMVAKRAASRGIWRTILGFGLLFFGMTLMSHELKTVSKMPEFVRFFSMFDCAPSASGLLPIGGVLGAIAVGTLCTMVVQSSSATIGITIALAEAGLTNIWTAIPIVLGDNIGTTITAALASIGANVNAKRTALAHALFNLIGTALIVTSFVFVFASPSRVNAPAYFHLVNAVTSGDCFAGINIGRHVAMAHTLFNLTNVFVLMFFIPLLARLCRAIIPTREDERVSVLESHLLETPPLAFEAVRIALGDLTRRAWTVASVAIHSCLGKVDVSVESIENAESEIDRLRNEIRDYLIALSQSKLSVRATRAIPEFLHCANDAERISDLALKVYRKSERVKDELRDAGSSLQVIHLTATIRTLAHATVKAVKNGTSMTLDMKSAEREAKELARGEHVQESLAMLSLFNCLEDITRHLGNIAERSGAMV